MKNSHAFTLIELLVVVLIIGILAAVALPQYQKAVDRAHLASYIKLSTQIRDAQNVYFWEHGTYAGNLANLDLNINLADYCQSVHNTNAFAWNCRYGFGLDNHNAGSAKEFRLMWCPQYQSETITNYQDCWLNTSAIISFYYGTATSPNAIRCTHSNDRGKHLCQSLK